MSRKVTLTAIVLALTGFAITGFAQDSGTRKAELLKLAQKLEEAKKERARLDERIFELAWCLQESTKNKDKPPVTALPKVELSKLPEGHSWRKGGYFTGQVFLVDSSAEKTEAPALESALFKVLNSRLRDRPGGGKKPALPKGVHALDGTVALAPGKTFQVVIAVYADERNTHYAEPLVVVRDGRIDVRVRTWQNDMIRSMDYRPRVISSQVSVSVDDTGVYTLDIGRGAVGRVRVS